MQMNFKAVDNKIPILNYNKSNKIAKTRSQKVNWKEEIYQNELNTVPKNILISNMIFFPTC